MGVEKARGREKLGKSSGKLLGVKCAVPDNVTKSEGMSSKALFISWSKPKGLGSRVKDAANRSRPQRSKISQISVCAR